MTRFSTNIPTNGVFFTDANGRQLVKRKRDTRETWPYRVNLSDDLSESTHLHILAIFKIRMIKEEQSCSD